MNVWLMKTFKQWAERFLTSTPPFVALDEYKVDVDYGSLTKDKRRKLFNDISKQVEKQRRWGHIQRFFDQFYDDVEIGDLLVIGTGKASEFRVTAIVRITSNAYYVDTPHSEDSRHRRDVEIIWQGTPILAEKWGWANRLECLESVDRLKQFIEVYTKLTSSPTVAQQNETIDHSG